MLTTTDPTARVPACPDWDAADLLWHLTDVQWFWGTVIAGRPTASEDDLAHPERPPTYEGLLEAYDSCSARLVRELEAADPIEAAWSWSPDRTVGFTFRRQAHEALIHRLDAEQTAGGGHVTVLDPALATDGVSELFEVMYGGEPPAWARTEPSGHHVRVDLTDVGVSLWTQPCLLFGTDPDSGTNYDGPHVLLVDDPGTPPSAVVSGAAGDVDAWLWKRRDDRDISITGDAEASAALMAAVSPSLD